MPCPPLIRYVSKLCKALQWPVRSKHLVGRHRRAGRQRRFDYYRDEGRRH